MYLVQTVQTSWRPQLPLPKDYPPAAENTGPTTSSKDTNSPTPIMDKSHHTPKHQPPLAGSHHHHHTAPAELPAGNRNNNNKWSLGGLFRRKKKSDAPDGDNSAGDSSSDEATNRSSSNKDKSTTPKSRSRARRAGHKLKEAFDHIVVTPLADRHKQPPVHPQHQQQQHQQRLTATPPESIRSGGSGSLDRRLRRERIRAARVYSRDPDQQAGSSDEALATIDGDAISHNSLSSMSRFRSDESLANSAGSGSHRRSRSARTERYMKRLSKGDDGSLGGGHHSGSGRWQTQPVQYSHHQQQQQQQILNQSYVPAHQVNQMYHAHATPIVVHQPLRSSASMSHVPSQSSAHWNVPMRPKYPPPADAIPNNRSISYEAQLHQLNRTGTAQQQQQQQQQQQYANPPPPPPRDPQRRLTMNAAVGEQARPVSYAFDAHHHPHPMQSVQQQHNTHGPPLAVRMPARCVSDDRLWGTNDSRASSQYSTTFALPQPQTVNSQRRFITRNPDAQPAQPAVAASAASAFRYVADAAPRSRRPIHMVNNGQPQAGKPSGGSPAPSTEPRIVRTGKSGLPTLASPMKNAADFWKKLDKESASPSPSKLQMKPRSVSHSRVHAPAGRYHTQESVDHVDGVVTGSLVLKPSRSCVFQPTMATNRYELSTPAISSADSKGDSLPSYYTPKKEPTVNKYDEHVAKNIAAPPQPFKYGAAKPFAYIAAADLTPPMSATVPVLKPIGVSNRKSTNLEDAINELEAIYKSLRLDNDPQLLDRAERRDLTSTLDQASASAAARYAPASSSDIDSDSPGGAGGAGEPDVVLDDVVYRNLKRANSIPRTVDAQPMFGIPIGPIAPSPVTDYLHAESTSVRTSRPMFVAQKSPDPVADDLAVRLLRKDVAMAAAAASQSAIVGATQVTPRGRTRTTTTTMVDEVDSPASSGAKKNRAVRSMSANIYSLIQRDAAKPSGGCLEDYSQLERATKLGSLNDIASDVSDHPSTLFMLQRERKLSESTAEAEARSQLSAKSTSRGAVFNLPSTLRSSPRTSPVKPPMPLPRSPIRASSQTTDTPVEKSLADNSGMNDILNAIAKEAHESSAKLSRDLYELRNEIKAQQQHQQQAVKMNEDIERAAEEAQKCLSVLQDVVKDEPTDKPAPNKRVDNEERMMRDIQSVGDAAKKCEKVLVSALDKQPRTASLIKPQPKEVEVAAEEEPTSIAKLLEKLEPESRKIGAIAERCMRQLSQLGDMHDEIFGKQAKPVTSMTGDYDNLHASLYGSPKPSTSQASDAAEIVQITNKCKPTVQEELDKIMAECAEEAEKLSQPIIKVDKYEHESERPKSDEEDDEDNEEMNIILLPPNALTPTQPYEERTIACCSSTVTFDDNLPVPDPTARTETNTSASKSSSDDRKSSSNTPNRAHSSSITSFNAQSSSDYGKSLSVSAAGSEDVKSNSTTSCDVRSTTTTATTTSTTNDSSFSNRSPSPLRLTPSGDERSLYNSSEELAMIFGIRSEGSAQSNKQPQSGKSSASLSGTATTVSPSSPATTATATATTATTVTVTPACASATHQAPATTSPQQHTILGNESAISPSDIRSAFVSLATILEAHEEFHTNLDQLDLDESGRMSPLYKSNSVNIGGLMAASGETSYSSMESIESTPDSGNHSLNDYPLTTVATTTTATTTLTTATTSEPTDSYTFRSELTINTAEVHQIEPVFTSELSIEHTPEETRFLKELSHCEEVTIVIEPESEVKPVAVTADTIASIEERFNDIYDELIEINDEFFRCSTSLSLTTIHEDDERDFERLVREECGDLQFDEDAKSIDERNETSTSHTDADATRPSQTVSLPPSTSRPTFTSSDVTEAVAVAGGVHTMEPNHLLWACTLALADSDLLTLLAIVVAIITILALILF